MSTEIPEVAVNLGQDALELLEKTKMRCVYPRFRFVWLTLWYGFLSRCGGCGSKVGSTLLSRVLKQIKATIPKAPHVISGVGGGEFYTILRSCWLI